MTRSPVGFLALAVLLAGCGGSTHSSTPLPSLPTRTAAREGFDPVRLEAADRRYEATKALVSVLVMRHGHVVFEHYYHGSNGTEERDVFSVTKSIVSALIGIALSDGKLRSLDQRLVDFFPQELESNADPRLRAITLRDLLTMTAGYRPVHIVSTDDWVRTLLNRSLASDPGKTFAYDDGSAHLLSAVLTKVTGERADELAQHELFGPLGIRVSRWTSDGQGHALGSTGLFLRPRELVMLGQLYLQKGSWRGREVIPGAWVRDSTRTQVSIPGGYSYGYLWWVNTGSHKGFVAQGYAGQMLAVYPRLDLVVAMTGAGEFDRIDALRQLLRAIVPMRSG